MTHEFANSKPTTRTSSNYRGFYYNWQPTDWAYENQLTTIILTGTFLLRAIAQREEEQSLVQQNDREKSQQRSERTRFRSWTWYPMRPKMPIYYTAFHYKFLRFFVPIHLVAVVIGIDLFHVLRRSARSTSLVAIRHPGPALKANSNSEAN